MAIRKSRKASSTPKRAGAAVEAPAEAVQQVAKQPLAGWHEFFRCQRSPILRSQLLAALMAGKQLVATRIPTAALADAVMLSTMARGYCNAEIVDDYAELLQRTRDVWAEPTWTIKVFDSLHLAKVGSILLGFDKAVCSEDLYVPDMVQAYLEEDVPSYFAVEFDTDADERAWRKKAQRAK